MKKNFMAIASLLIAAMLMVVSCAPEANVEGKVEDGLVEAKLNVAFGKAVNIRPESGAMILYKYSLTPKWGDLNQGKAPYGQKSNVALTNTNGENKYCSVSGSTDISSLGYVTPGLWQVDVKGYLCEMQEGGAYHDTGIIVLEGTTTKYFGNGNNTVTVFVAPKASDEETAKGKITIELEMQDLGKEGDDLKYKLQYRLDGGDYTNFANITSISGKAASLYTSTINATTGYHTISFKITDKEGGVTRSFYLLKGNDIKITGSVTPSEFANEGAKIEVLQIPEGTITLESINPNDTSTSEGEVSYKHDSTATATANFTLPEEGSNITLVESTYTWYWGPVDKANASSIITSTSNDTATITLPTNPGRYTLSCIVSCAVTITYDDNSYSTHTIEGDATLQEFLVV